MGDLRHKKSPPTNEAEEDNTPEFREAARAALANNAIANRIRKKRKGDPGYLISNQAELADAIDADRTTIKKLLGGQEHQQRPRSRSAASTLAAFGASSILESPKS